ncbi:MAG: NAD-dependent epimerase/dehydratase family protein [Anaerolineae bacterium]|nr:NAD-dependent epimerase/dehydratase family protein [Anaerolineae bacterium]
MRVLVTGVASSLGRLVAERLLAEPAVETVIGLDDRACRPLVPGIRFVRANLRRPEWTSVLDGVDAAVVLGGVQGWLSGRSATMRLVEDGKYILRAMITAGVPKIITGSSMVVYGPQPRVPITETLPVRGHQASPYARSLALLSDYVDTLAQPGTTITRLRSAWVCGPHESTPMRYLASRPVLACGHTEHRIQAVHEDDLVAAFWLAIRHDLPGVYNVAADDGCPVRDVAALVGCSRVCVPLPWLALRGWLRLRGFRRSSGWVRALYCSGHLDTARLRAAGWRPAYSTRQVLAEGLAMVRPTV